MTQNIVVTVPIECHLACAPLGHAQTVAPASASKLKADGCFAGVLQQITRCPNATDIKKGAIEFSRHSELEPIDGVSAIFRLDF